MEAGRGNFSGLPGMQGVGESAGGSLFLGALARSGLDAIARSGQLSVAHLLPLLMSCEAWEGVACRINCGQSACS